MTIKRAYLLCIFLVVVFSLNANESPRSDNSDEFTLEIISDGLSLITGYTGTNKEVRISTIMRNTRVVAISENAFAEKGITRVVIPDSVVLIGKNAFAKNEITNITIGSYVTIQEGAFELGFDSYYSGNSRRGGTYNYANGSWSVQAAQNTTNTTSASSKKPGISYDLEPYSSFMFAIGVWDFGPSAFVPRLALSAGFMADFSSFTFGIIAECGGFFGLAIPLFNDIGVTYGYHFGSFLEFYIDPFGFSLGGGITSGNFSTKDDLLGKFFFPFAELNLWAGDDSDSIGIYFRYYFNDSKEFYNKFSIGIKTRTL